MIDYFLLPEQMKDENKYLCESEICKKTYQDGFKSFKIEKAPDHLMINFARFKYHINDISKIFQAISFPEYLLLPIIPNEVGHIAQEYILYGVIIHSGQSSHSGHYYTYARSSLKASMNSDSAQWFKLNDDDVGASSFDSFKNITSSYPRDCAYILFYVKKDTPLISENNERIILEEYMKEIENDNTLYMNEIQKRTEVRQRKKNKLSLPNR